MSDINFGIDITEDNLGDFEKALKELRSQAVFAGFPEDKDKPREDPDGESEPITNAALAYIHDKGMPEQNIPARPIMEPGVESVQEEIVAKLEQTGLAALDGNLQGVENGFQAVGLIAQNGIRQRILDGPFVPLAESTLRARARMGGEVGAAAQRELDGTPSPSGDPNVRPLNVTGQLRNAATYVVRKEE
ncbi:hypothetical protein DYQ86_16055 [Acidobacteria bacterium AB60]|nr:hypothetical protein DYQ86_16055 [Acidobacteria bacterium AB60]